jgi:hypothetical protein
MICFALLGIALCVNVSAQSELHYNWFMGTVFQDGKRLNPKQVKEVMSVDSEALRLYNKGRILENVSSGAIAIWAGTMAYDILTESDNMALRLVSAGAFGVGLTTGIISWTIIGNSTKTYNSNLRKDVSYQFDFGITPTGGVGLTMRF